MQILGVGHDIAWLPLPNEIALMLDDQLPPPFRHYQCAGFGL